MLSLLNQNKKIRPKIVKRWPRAAAAAAMGRRRRLRRPRAPPVGAQYMPTPPCKHLSRPWAARFRAAAPVFALSRGAASCCLVVARAGVVCAGERGQCAALCCRPEWVFLAGPPWGQEQKLLCFVPVASFCVRGSADSAFCTPCRAAPPRQPGACSLVCPRAHSP